jgi:hypothetical protein
MGLFLGVPNLLDSWACPAEHGLWRLANGQAFAGAFSIAYFDSLGARQLFAVL